MFLVQILIAIVLLALGCIVVVTLRPDLIDRLLNTVIVKPPYVIDEEVRQKHASLCVVDLHADPLLWARDPLEEHDYGHLDLPRLIEGGVALQVFGVVTKYTMKVKGHYPATGLDIITALALVQRWPIPTWTSLFQRALHKAGRLKGFVDSSGGDLMFIRSAQDIDQLVAGRESNARLTGALLSLEGTHALEGNIDNLDALYDANFRMIGLTHFFDNEAGGAAGGVVEGGLTPFGVELVKKIQQKRMVIDLAHASSALVYDVLDITEAPVMISHVGVQGTYPATGGLVGIAPIRGSTGGDTIEDAAHAMRYIAELVGVDYAALGTDYDGVIQAPMDVTGLPLLTGALLDMGFNLEEVGKIMGGNALRVLRQVLPVS